MSTRIETQNWRRIFLAVLALVLTVGLLHIRKHFIDYGIYETAANKILHRDAVHLYERDRFEPMGNYYSYFWGLCFIPFALLGTLGGKIAFALTFFASYWVILKFAVRSALEVVGRPRDEQLFYKVSLLTIAVSIYALNDAFMNSNIGVLLAAMCVIAFEQREKRAWLSVVLVSAAAVFKVYPAFFLGFWVWERRFKSALAMCVMGAFFYVGVPMLLEGPALGWRLVQDHIYVVGQYGQQRGWAYDVIVYQNLHATLMRYAGLVGFDKNRVFKISVYGSLVAIACFFLPSFLVPPRARSRSFTLKMFALAMACVPIITPVSWYNMGLFYVPLMAISVAQGPLAGAGRERVKKCFFAAFVVLYCLTTGDLVGNAFNDQLEFYAVPFAGLLFLVIPFAYDLWRERRE